MGEITRGDIYREQYAHFRAMNDILYKIPPLFTAVLGGLWYFAVTNLENDKWISCAVFAFAAVGSICFVNIMQRFRVPFNLYLDNLNKMDGDLKVSTKSSLLPSAIVTIQVLLWTAALVSVLGVFYAAHK